MDKLLPDEAEVYKWVLSSVKHSFHVEYYLEQFKTLGVEFHDPQRPHDLEGSGNRLELDIIKGFALQYREPKVDFDTYLKPALETHRQGQYHHQKWNGRELPPNASGEDLILGAIDAVCSLREPRGYQGGKHSWGDVIKISQDNPNYKKENMLGVIPLMLSVVEPDLESITSLSNIPNIGVDQSVYNEIIKRKDAAVEMLKEHGYSLV